MFKKLESKIALVLIIALAVLIVPMHPARAFLFGLDNFAASAVLQLIGFSMTWMSQIAGDLIAFCAKILNVAVKVRAGGDIPVVKATWKILRDFSNMMFIIMLIYMAFSTIFDEKKYAFGTLITRFIVVAVLINFSLVIGNLFIDACQVLNNVFLGSIGNLGDRLGSYMNVANLIPAVNGADLTITAVASVVATFILTLIFLFSIGVATVFAIIRVPFIWALLIVSPLAWMSYILPGTQSWWTKWWSQFRGWNLFLPVYLFYMYLGLLFLSKRNQIMAAVIQANPAGGDAVNTPILAGLSNTLSFNMIFFYIFAAFVMIGGTKAAVSTTSMMGSGFDKGVGWARKTMGKITGYDVRAAAVKSAATSKLGEFQQKGFENKWLNKVYGGKEGDQRIQGKYAERFGVSGAAEKRLAADVSAEKGRLQNKDTRELEGMINNNSLPERRQLAARELLKERNQLTGSEIINTYHAYERDNPQSALKFANSIDYGKLSSAERRDIFDEIPNIELRKKIAGVMADKGDMTNVADITHATTLFNQDADKAEFIKKAAKRITDATVLRPLMTTGSADEQLAVRQILTDRGKLNGAELFDTYNMFEDGSQAAQDFGKKLDFKNFKKAERRTWFDHVEDVEVKRKIAEVMAEKGELEGLDPVNPLSGVILSGADWLAASARLLYANGAQKIDFVQKAEGEKFMASIEAKSQLATTGDIEVKLRGATITSVPQMLEARTSRMKAEDIAKVDRDAWGVGAPLGSPPTLFYRAIESKIQERQRAEPAVPAAMGRGGVMIPPKLGGGDLLKANILKEVTDAGKAAIVNSIVP